MFVAAQIETRVRLCSDDPRDVGDVGQAELGAAEKWARAERRVQLGELGIEGLGRVPIEDDAVVGPGKAAEALDPEPNERALGRDPAGGAAAPDGAPRGTP